MAAEKGEIPNTLTFSIPMGGQSGTLMFFKSVTYWPTLSKFRGGPVKKNTLYFYFFFQPGSRPKVPGLQLLQLRPSTFSLHLQRFPTIQLFCCSLNNPDSIPNPHDVFYRSHPRHCVAKATCNWEEDFPKEFPVSRTM